MKTNRPLTYRQRAEVFTQLAALEHAGIPHHTALAMLDTREAQIKSRAALARGMFAKGFDLALAGEKSALFTRLEAAILRAALSAGSPVLVYRRLADLYSQKSAQLQTLRARMLMPAFIALLSVLIEPVPELIAGALSPGAYLRHTLSLLALAGLGIYLILRVPSWLEQGFLRNLKPIVDHVALKLPLLGQIRVRKNVRDFYANLGLMLEAGLAMHDALPKALETVANLSVRKEFTALERRVRSGANLCQALQGFAYAGTSRSVELICTGEASGRLPEMLRRCSENETAQLDAFDEQFFLWIPRLVYALIAAGMAYSLLTSGAFLPRA
ncbi:MAG: type II secretion system F family protein [Burkholderiales bacterium]